MGIQEDKDYAQFEEKVARTVYLDNIAPQATVAVLKTALGQFGNVISAQFVPNYLDYMDIPQCALVEMETAKQAKAVITQMATFPFMMSGMPRPVRAKQAVPEMFGDHPTKSGRKIDCRWVRPDDPEFQVAKKSQELIQKHTAEVVFLLELQMEEEESLTKQQVEMLKAHHKKYDMIESITRDGTLQRLGRQYKINVTVD